MSASKIKLAMGNTTIVRNKNRSFVSPIGGFVFLGNTWLFDNPNEDFIKYIIIHEFGHVWDFKKHETLSIGMAMDIGTMDCSKGNGLGCRWDTGFISEVPPGKKTNDNYASTGKWEDWAEAFATYIFPGYYASMKDYNGLGQLRETFVKNQIDVIR